MTYVGRKERIFSNAADTRLITRSRSEGQLMTYDSVLDMRAWCDDVEERRQHILDVVGRPRKRLEGIVPINKLYDAIADTQNVEVDRLKQHIKDLERKINIYSSINLSPEQIKTLQQMKDELTEAEQHMYEVQQQNNYDSQMSDNELSSQTSSTQEQITTKGTTEQFDSTRNIDDKTINFNGKSQPSTIKSLDKGQHRDANGIANISTTNDFRANVQPYRDINIHKSDTADIKQDELNEIKHPTTSTSPDSGVILGIQCTTQNDVGETRLPPTENAHYSNVTTGTTDSKSIEKEHKAAYSIDDNRETVDDLKGTRENDNDDEMPKNRTEYDIQNIEKNPLIRYIDEEESTNGMFRDKTKDYPKKINTKPDTSLNENVDENISRRCKSTRKTRPWSIDASFNENHTENSLLDQTTIPRGNGNHLSNSEKQQLNRIIPQILDNNVRESTITQINLGTGKSRSHSSQYIENDFSPVERERLRDIIVPLISDFEESATSSVARIQGIATDDYKYVQTYNKDKGLNKTSDVTPNDDTGYLCLKKKGRIRSIMRPLLTELDPTEIANKTCVSRDGLVPTVQPTKRQLTTSENTRVVNVLRQVLAEVNKQYSPTTSIDDNRKYVCRLGCIMQETALPQVSSPSSKWVCRAVRNMQGQSSLLPHDHSRPSQSVCRANRTIQEGRPVTPCDQSQSSNSVCRAIRTNQEGRSVIPCDQSQSSKSVCRAVRKMQEMKSLTLPDQANSLKFVCRPVCTVQTTNKSDNICSSPHGTSITVNSINDTDTGFFSSKEGTSFSQSICDEVSDMIGSNIYPPLNDEKLLNITKWSENNEREHTEENDLNFSNSERLDVLETIIENLVASDEEFIAKEVKDNLKGLKQNMLFFKQPIALTPRACKFNSISRVREATIPRKLSFEEITASQTHDDNGDPCTNIFNKCVTVCWNKSLVQNLSIPRGYFSGQNQDYSLVPRNNFPEWATTLSNSHNISLYDLSNIDEEPHAVNTYNKFSKYIPRGAYLDNKELDIMKPRKQFSIVTLNRTNGDYDYAETIPNQKTIVVIPSDRSIGSIISRTLFGEVIAVGIICRTVINHTPLSPKTLSGEILQRRIASSEVALADLVCAGIAISKDKDEKIKHGESKTRFETKHMLALTEDETDIVLECIAKGIQESMDQKLNVYNTDTEKGHQQNQENKAKTVIPTIEGIFDEYGDEDSRDIYHDIIEELTATDQYLEITKHTGASEGADFFHSNTRNMITKVEKCVDSNRDMVEGTHLRVDHITDDEEVWQDIIDEETNTYETWKSIKEIENMQKRNLIDVYEEPHQHIPDAKVDKFEYRADGNNGDIYLDMFTELTETPNEYLDVTEYTTIHEDFNLISENIEEYSESTLNGTEDTRVSFHSITEHITVNDDLIWKDITDEAININKNVFQSVENIQNIENCNLFDVYKEGPQQNHVAKVEELAVITSVKDTSKDNAEGESGDTYLDISEQITETPEEYLDVTQDETFFETTLYSVKMVPGNEKNVDQRLNLAVAINISEVDMTETVTEEDGQVWRDIIDMLEQSSEEYKEVLPNLDVVATQFNNASEDTKSLIKKTKESNCKEKRAVTHVAACNYCSDDVSTQMSEMCLVTYHKIEPNRESPMVIKIETIVKSILSSALSSIFRSEQDVTSKLSSISVTESGTEVTCITRESLEDMSTDTISSKILSQSITTFAVEEKVSSTCSFQKSLEDIHTYTQESEDLPTDTISLTTLSEYNIHAVEKHSVSQTTDTEHVLHHRENIYIITEQKINKTKNVLESANKDAPADHDIPTDERIDTYYSATCCSKDCQDDIPTYTIFSKTHSNTDVSEEKTCYADACSILNPFVDFPPDKNIEDSFHSATCCTPKYYTEQDKEEERLTFVVNNYSTNEAHDETANNTSSKASQTDITSLDHVTVNSQYTPSLVAPHKISSVTHNSQEKDLCSMTFVFNENEAPTCFPAGYNDDMINDKVEGIICNAITQKTRQNILNNTVSCKTLPKSNLETLYSIYPVKYSFKESINICTENVGSCSNEFQGIHTKSMCSQLFSRRNIDASKENIVNSKHSICRSQDLSKKVKSDDKYSSSNTDGIAEDTIYSKEKKSKENIVKSKHSICSSQDLSTKVKSDDKYSTSNTDGIAEDTIYSSSTLKSLEDTEIDMFEANAYPSPHTRSTEYIPNPLQNIFRNYVKSAHTENTPVFKHSNFSDEALCDNGGSFRKYSVETETAEFVSLDKNGPENSEYTTSGVELESDILNEFLQFQWCDNINQDRQIFRMDCFHCTSILKDSEVIKLRADIQKKDEYCAEPNKLTSQALEKIEDIKHITEERDDLRKKLENSQNELEELKRSISKGNPMDCRAQNNVDVSSPIRKTDIENSCEQEICQLEMEIETMRKTTKLTADMEAKIIRKEVECLKKYCSKLAAIQGENITLKRKLKKSEEKLESLGFAGGDLNIEEIAERLSALDIIIKERDVLSDKVQKLEKELCAYSDLPEDVEVFKKRSIILDDVIKDRDRLAKRLEQLRGLDQEVLELRRKAERVDELERQLKVAIRDTTVAEDELDSIRNKCAMAEMDVLAHKTETDNLRSKVVCMEHEIEGLKSMCKEQELLEIERDRLQSSLDELLRIQNDYEHMCIQLKGMDIVKAERDMYRLKYDQLIGVQYECDTLKAQVEKAIVIEREREAMEHHIQELEECICEQEEEIKRLVSNIDCIVQGKDKQQSKMRNLLTDMQRELEKKDAIIVTSEMKLASVQDELKISIEDLRNETNALRARNHKLEQQVQVLSVENENLIGTVEERENTISTFQNIVNQRDVMIKNIQDSSSEIITTLQQNLETVQAENQFLEETVRKLGESNADNDLAEQILKNSEDALIKVTNEISRQYQEFDMKSKDYENMNCRNCTCMKKNSMKDCMTDPINPSNTGNKACPCDEGSGVCNCGDKGKCNCIEKLKALAAAKGIRLEDFATWDCKTGGTLRDNVKQLEDELKRSNDTIITLGDKLAKLEMLSEENNALRRHSNEVQDVAKSQIEDLVDHLKKCKDRVLELETVNEKLREDLENCRKEKEEADKMLTSNVLTTSRRSSKLENELDSFLNQNKQLSIEKEQLNKEKKDLEDQNKTLGDQVAALTAENDELRKELEKMKQKMESCTDTNALEALQLENEKLKDMIQKQKEQITDLLEKLKTPMLDTPELISDQEKDHLQSIIDDLQRQLANVKGMDTIKTISPSDDLMKTIEDLTKRLEEEQRRADAAEEALKKLKQGDPSAMLADEVATLKFRIAELEEENKALKDAMTQANNENIKLKQKLDEALNENSKLQTSLGAVIKEKDDLKKEIDKLKEIADPRLTDENAKLKNNLSQLEGEMAALMAESERAKKAIDLMNKLQEENDMFKKQAAQIEAENSRLKSSLVTAQSELNKAQEKMLQLESEKDRLKQIINDLESQLAKLKKELDDALNNAKNAAINVSDMQKEIAMLKQKLANLEAENTQQKNELQKIGVFGDMKQENEAIKKANSELEKQLEELKKQLLNAKAAGDGATGLEDELARLRERLHQMETENAVLKKDLSTAKAESKGAVSVDELDKLRQQLAMLQGDNDKLKKDLGKALEDVKNANDNLVNCKAEAEKQKAKLADLESQISKLKNELNTSLDEQRKTAGELALLQTEQAKLKQKLALLDTENSKLKKDYEEARITGSDMPGLRDENANLKQKIAQLEMENTKLKKELDAALANTRTEENEKKKLLDDNNKLKSQIGQLQDEIERLKRTLQETNDIEMLRQKLGLLESENAKLKKSLDDTKSELAQNKSELDKLRQQSGQLESDKIKLKKDLDDARNQASKLNDELDKLKDSEKMCKQRLALLEAENAKLKKDLQAKIEEAKINAAALSDIKDDDAKRRQRTAQLEAENAKLKKDLDEALNKLRKLQDEQSALANENANMKQKLAKAEADITKLSKGTAAEASAPFDDSKLRQRLEQLEAENKKLKTDLNSTLDQVKKAGDDFARLTDEDKKLKQRLAELEAENSRLKKDLDKALNDASVANAAANNLRNENSKLKDKISQQESQISNLKKDVQSALEDAKRAASALANFQAEGEKLKQKIAQLEKENSSIKSADDKAKLQEQNNQQKQRISQLEDELNKLKKALDDRKQDDGEISKFKDENAKLKQRIIQLEDENAKLKKELENTKNSLKDETNKTQQKISDLQALVDKLKKDLLSAQALAEKTAADLATARDNEANLKQKMAQLENEKTQLKKDIDDARGAKTIDETARLRKENEALKSQIKQLQDQLDKLKSDLIHAPSEDTALKDELAKLKQKIAQLEKENVQFKEELDSARQQSTEGKKEIDNLKNQNAKLKNRIVSLEEELASLRKQLEKSGSGDNLQEENKKLRDKLAQFENEIAKLKKELEEGRKQLAALDALKVELDKLRQDNGKLQGDLKAAKSELNKALGDAERAKELDDYERKIKQLYDELARQKKQCDDTIASMKEQFDRDLKNLLNKNNNSIDKLQKAHDDIISDLNQKHDIEVKGLKDALKNCQSELDRLKKLLDDQKRKSIEIKGKVDEVENLVARERRKSKDLTIKSSEASRKLEDELNNAKKLHDAIVKEAEQLKTDLENEKKRSQDLQDKLDELMKKLAELEKAKEESKSKDKLTMATFNIDSKFPDVLAISPPLSHNEMKLHGKQPCPCPKSLAEALKKVGNQDLKGLSFDELQLLQNKINEATAKHLQLSGHQVRPGDSDRLSPMRRIAALENDLRRKQTHAQQKIKDIQSTVRQERDRLAQVRKTLGTDRARGASDFYPSLQHRLSPTRNPRGCLPPRGNR